MLFPELDNVQFPKVKVPKKVKPLGKMTPWVWVIEPTHGCNLSCGHCSCALDEKGKYHFMNMDTWTKTWQIIANVSPTCRIDLCLGGEPTLHKDLPAFLKKARDISPLSQIQITTNGTMLKTGTISIQEYLESGANIVYIDMYGPKDEFRNMAKLSGYPWYEYYAAPKNAPSPWTYHGPEFKLVVLQEQPENWPQSRFRAGLLGTWYNHLDWEKAKRFGLRPVIKPLTRRCNQPFLYVNVDSHGYYLLCCQDNTGETAGMFGSVHEDIEGFMCFWFGKDLQLIRQRLRNKNRADTSQCSRCCITFSRCDFKHWTDEQVNQWWNGSEWLPVK